MGSERDCRRLKVLIFPWLAHGHITPFLELAKKLSISSSSERNTFHFYICSTPVNLTSIRSKISPDQKHSINLIELHLPTTPELPPHYHTTNGLPLNLHSTLRKALKKSKHDFSNLLQTLNPDLLVHDIITPWAGSVASLHEIPSLAFFTSGATMFSYFCHMGVHPGVEFPFPAIRLSSFELSMVHGYTESYQNEEKDPDDEAYSQNSNGIILINTSREVEGKYIDYLSTMINKKIIPVGALVQDPKIRGDDDEISDLMKWLGQKEANSTVFVSFGSEYFLKKEEIEEIAHGLELSSTNFIWIIRFPKGGEMSADEALPLGFRERVGERGRIVENWAPQAEILSHSSVAGFVSHCGWNSLMEGIEFRVPIIAVPMHLDQPMNARLVVELGVGVEARRDDDGRITREEIAKVIRDVVCGEIGGELRRRVGEKREGIRVRSRQEIEGVAELLAELCGK